MATHLCMFGTDHRNTGRSPCGGDSMAYTSTFNGERFVTRVHLADCDVCLVTAEQLITAGFAKYVEVEAYEDYPRVRMVAQLELTRDVSAFAPPGDWWVCPCRPFQSQEPNPFVEVIRLTSGEMRALGASKNRCRFCEEAQGEHYSLGRQRSRAAGYLLTGVTTPAR